MDPLNLLRPEVITGVPCRRVRYFTTTRLSWSGHHRADLLPGKPPGEPQWLRQVHGSAVHDADRSEAGMEPPAADAAFTSTQGVVLAIVTADCMPVVIAAEDGGALAIAHAGWRGLAAGVLENTVAALRSRHAHGDRVPWRAWIGPAISQRHFEVGSDVFDAFVGQDPCDRAYFATGPARDKWLADLPGLARRRLLALGVHSVELSGLCTYARPDLFHSYRREPHAGRLLTLGWLLPDNPD